MRGFGGKRRPPLAEVEKAIDEKAVADAFSQAGALMARMIPTSPGDFHGSRGEQRVFRALRTLPDEVVVIHSFRWLHPGNATALTQKIGAQGEGDFVLFDPGRGIMVVEVKGGQVWCEQGQWRQKNRLTGHIDFINPEAQASNTLFRIRTEILDRVPEARKILFCHAVWFPDGVVDRTKLPMNYHRDMTLDSEDVAQPAVAIDKAFNYWRSRFSGRKGVDAATAKRILAALAPSMSMVRSVRQTLDEREEQFIQLTQEQARIIGFLDEQLHAAIIGAAGTGKTILAIEKARRLASPTKPVLFLCFNAALREHLEEHHALANVRFLTFHGFARDLLGNDGTLDDVTEALLERLSNDGPLPYEHLVVDEGQDFERDWLDFLRYRFRNGSFYIFYDRYQAIQGEQDTKCLDDIPCRLVLSRNCRNTDPIARVAYRAGGLDLTPTLGLDGPKPVLHHVADVFAAVEIAEHLIQVACERHKIAPHDIAVLTLETFNEGSLWNTDRLGGRHTSDKPKLDCVTRTTVRRFKGLEATLVIVVDVDLAQAIDQSWRRRFYVACSRARHAVHIITTTPEAQLGEPLRALAQTEKVRPSWRAFARHLGVRLGGKSDDPFNEPEAG